MEEKTRTDIALFRYGILAPLIQRQVEDKRPWVYFKQASKKKYEYIDGTYKSITTCTMVRWYKTYLKEGFDGLKPIRRADIGTSRKMNADIDNLIAYYTNEYPRLPATQIYQRLLDKGDITKQEISLSTITRAVKKHKASKDSLPLVERRRYEKENINEVWYGDTTYGPYININGENKRVFIIALIDDASRLITGCEAFFEDNYINLMKVLKSAISSRGKSRMLSFDNGANYKCKQMKVLAARIGVAINYCPPFTATSKAKIERFFRTLKDQYLCTIKPNDYKNLEDFNKDLRAYIHKYNTSNHSSLGEGVSPTDRFYSQSELIIQMTDEEIERSFLLEEDRKVSNDCVIKLNNQLYEIDYHYQNQKILIRYSPDLSKVYVVDRDDGSLKEIKLLDKKGNSKIKRKKVKLAEDND